MHFHLNSRKTFRNLLYIAMLCLLAGKTQAVTYRVLFLGNSYTSVNNLPALISGLATSTGDQMIYSSNMPGGYTFQQQSTDATTLGLIMQGNWDYVVLQEQSQLPSFPDDQVAEQVYPFARTLDSLVKAYNPCAKTVFYMTWGRKNGDASNCPFFPPLCTYQGMDSLLQLRYTIMAQDNGAYISPVAKVWRQLRNTQPSLELYNADESHPSINGSYAAACTFYSILFGKDPTLCSFTSSVNGSAASIIKATVKQYVFDSLNIYQQYDAPPQSDFSYAINGNTVTFTGSALQTTNVKWYFGDGDSSIAANPIHTYASAGTYTAKMVAYKCNLTDTMSKTFTLSGTTGINTSQELSPSIKIFPNPAASILFVEAEEAIDQMMVYDLNGRLILNADTLKANTIKLNIQSLPAGIYQAVIILKNTTVHKRFSKQ